MRNKQTTIGDLAGIFADASAQTALPSDLVAYRVAWHQAVADGHPGGLLFGWTELQPGKVGDEYFMTRGHFHAQRDTAEYYWGLTGSGLLLLMDEDRQFRSEIVHPGSLHYIPGKVAHRMINTGSDVLRFGACWPSDAGHDYTSIAAHGFSARVVQHNGSPQVVAV